MPWSGQVLELVAADDRHGDPARAPPIVAGLSGQSSPAITAALLKHVNGFANGAPGIRRGPGRRTTICRAAGAFT
ncbi:MAG: hypothetical protein HC814_04255 [Rhodobacteraceae bacterium]|nr:hypothetical protein [Paracoccaceae bacterium]